MANRSKYIAAGHRPCADCGLAYQVGRKRRHDATYSHRGAIATRRATAAQERQEGGQGGQGGQGGS